MVKSSAYIDDSKNNAAPVVAEHGKVDNPPKSKLPEWKFTVRPHLVSVVVETLYHRILDLS
jgi:hypothetical protein